uniref:Uncharacterized protein n=1 Tax=viral metagenome TaxID=1070528 RepID=A0A6C0LTV8_9ZZZZ
MGNCASADDTGDNYAPNLAEKVNLKIGESFTHPGFCEYRVGDNDTLKKVNCGNNGEFVPNGYDDSQACKCRALCNDGCRRRKCKRDNYSGTAEKCCTLGGNSYYAENNTVKTCDPTYRINNWGNNTCDQYMEKFCKQGNNLFTTPCRQWITTFQPTENNKDARVNGRIDSVLLDVCSRSENASKSECACIVAANEQKEKYPNLNGIPVQCMLNKCINDPAAYRTSSQFTPCNVVNCSIIIDNLDLINNNSGLFDLHIIQNCGNKNEPLPKNPPKTPSKKPITPEENLVDILKANWIIVGSIIILLIFVIIAIIILAIGKKKSK